MRLTKLALFLSGVVLAAAGPKPMISALIKPPMQNGGWSGGLLTYTTEKGDSAPPPAVDTSYTNWTFKDPKGGVHTFSQAWTEFVPDYRDVFGNFHQGFTTSWSGPSDDGLWVLEANGNTGTVSAIGHAMPRYQVLSVIYAPPGQRSFVDYGASTAIGTKTSLSDVFSRSYGISTSFGAVVASGSLSASWSNSVENYSSISINKTSSNNITEPGPLNSNDGINHDYDTIVLWLNPQVDLTNGPNMTSGTWSMSSNAMDPTSGMDIQYVYVGWLKNPSTMPVGVAAALARSWAGPGGGLTSEDFATIVARDPFWNGASQIDPTRFDVQFGQVLPYEPPPVGGQPLTAKYAVGYQQSTTQGTTATDSFTVKTDFKAGFGSLFSTTASASWSWVNKVTHESSYGSGQSATLSITGPGTGYAGPTRVQVYKDNVYGTFMFSFVP